MSSCKYNEIRWSRAIRVDGRFSFREFPYVFSCEIETNYTL